MIRLAFDLGTYCGVAWSNDEGDMYKYKLLDLSSKRHEGGGMRYLKFKQFLSAFKPIPDVVYYELVARHLGTEAAHVYGGLRAVLMAWCEENNIPYTGIPVGTIKKHATGKGNANKDMMIEAAREEFGYDGNSHDEADALWILDTGNSGLRNTGRRVNDDDEN